MLLNEYMCVNIALNINHPQFFISRYTIANVDIVNSTGTKLIKKILNLIFFVF